MIPTPGMHSRSHSGGTKPQEHDLLKFDVIDETNFSRKSATPAAPSNPSQEVSLRSDALHVAGPLLTLPDVLRTLADALRVCVSLAEGLLRNYKQIVTSFEMCAEILHDQGGANAGSSTPGDSSNDSSPSTYRLLWSLEQVNAHIDEMLSDQAMTQYVTTLNAKVMDRVVLLYHGSQQLQVSTRNLLSARAALRASASESAPSSSSAAASSSSKHATSWRSKVKRAFGGHSSTNNHPTQAPRRLSDSHLNHQDQSLHDVEAAYLDASAEQERVLRQFGALASTRLGPAFQNFLLAAVVIFADVAVIWEAGETQPPHGWVPTATGAHSRAPSRASSAYPTTSTPTASPRRHGTHGRSGSRGATSGSPFVVRASTVTFPLTDATTTHLATPPSNAFLSSTERVAAEGCDDDVDAALPGIDGVHDVREQAASFVESTVHVVSLFCKVAHTLKSVSDEITASMSMQDATTHALAYVTPELLHYITTVDRQLQDVINGPRSTWYMAKMEDDVLLPLRRLAKDRRRVIGRSASVRDTRDDFLSRTASSLGLADLLVRVTDSIAAVGRRPTSDAVARPITHGGTADHLSQLSSPQTNTCQSSAVSLAPGRASTSNLPDLQQQQQQQGQELERIWLAFVELGASLFSHVAKTISENVDYDVPVS